MTGPGILSLTYACCQMAAGYFFSHRLKAGLVVGSIGAVQGIVLALWSPDARGLVLSCTAYLTLNFLGYRSGRWEGAPWFRHPKEETPVRKLRDESTPEGRRIWADVDKAAARAPEWVREAWDVRRIEGESTQVADPGPFFDGTPGFCNFQWEADGLTHVCYLDQPHEGEHVCGYCDHAQHYEDPQ